jgi:hypothetical protein
MKYKIAIGILALTLLLTFSSACVVVVTNTAPNYNGTGNYTGGPTYYQTVPPKTQLLITRNELSTDGAGNRIGLVSIKNVGNVTQDIASVTGYFYDANMNLVYSSRDTILDLKPGESWDYTFTCSGANCNQVRTFKVDVTYGGGN